MSEIEHDEDADIGSDEDAEIERFTPEAIAETLRISEGGTSTCHLALFSLADLVREWIAATKALETIEHDVHRATVVTWRMKRRRKAAAERRDTTERALARAVKP